MRNPSLNMGCVDVPHRATVGKRRSTANDKPKGAKSAELKTRRGRKRAVIELDQRESVQRAGISAPQVAGKGVCLSSFPPPIAHLPRTAATIPTATNVAPLRHDDGAEAHAIEIPQAAGSLALRAGSGDLAAPAPHWATPLAPADVPQDGMARFAYLQSLCEAQPYQDLLNRVSRKVGG